MLFVVIAVVVVSWAVAEFSRNRMRRKPLRPTVPGTILFVVCGVLLLLGHIYDNVLGWGLLAAIIAIIYGFVQFGTNMEYRAKERLNPGTTPLNHLRKQPRLDPGKPESVVKQVYWMLGEATHPDHLSKVGDEIVEWNKNAAMKPYVASRLVPAFKRKATSMAAANPIWADFINNQLLPYFYEYVDNHRAPGTSEPQTAQPTTPRVQEFAARRDRLILAIDACGEPGFNRYQEISQEIDAMVVEPRSWLTIEPTELTEAAAILATIETPARELMARVQRHDTRISAKRAQALPPSPPT